MFRFFLKWYTSGKLPSRGNVGIDLYIFDAVQNCLGISHDFLMFFIRHSQLLACQASLAPGYKPSYSFGLHLWTSRNRFPEPQISGSSLGCTK